MIDICFVANKYTKLGRDKGYDVFIEVAKLFSSNSRVNFHVVGGFNETDINTQELNGKIFFYGKQNTSFFPDFYRSMDIILSPNRPYILAPGAFDGFPTGCCVEAGLCGVAVFCSDELNQNLYFQDEKDIVIIEPNAVSIYKIINGYINNPSKLYEIAKRGESSFKKIFSSENQLNPRINIINNILDAGDIKLKN